MDEIRKKRGLTVQYSAVQMFFWMNSCCIVSYGTVFLLNRGYNNTRLGIIVAIGSVIGLFVSSTLAAVIDRSRRVTVFHCLFGLLGAEAVFEILLSMTSGRSAFVSVIYSLLYSCVIAVQPLNTELCFQLDRTGRYIHFGFCRSMGSLAFVPLTFTMGRLCSDGSTSMLETMGFVTAILQGANLALILYFRKHSREGESAIAAKRPKSELSMPQFIRQNKRFSVMCIGTALIFFSHFISGYYLINIVRNLGGTSSDMGVVSACLATMEIPFLLLYTRLTRNFHCSSIIVFTSLMYILRALAFALAPNLKFLYLSTIMQGFTYALIIPALVDYVGLVIDYKDSAKGQALSGAASTTGTILSCLIGGIMFDNMTVRHTMLTAVAICCAGTIITILSIERRPKYCS